MPQLGCELVYRTDGACVVAERDRPEDRREIAQGQERLSGAIVTSSPILLGAAYQVKPLPNHPNSI